MFLIYLPEFAISVSLILLLRIYVALQLYMGQDPGETTNYFLEVTVHICVTSIEASKANSILNINYKNSMKFGRRNLESNVQGRRLLLSY